MNIELLDLCLRGIYKKFINAFSLDMYDSAAAFNEKWGYVNVRKDAHMFWWLYHTDERDYAKRPLIIWIQVSRKKGSLLKLLFVDWLIF